MDPREVRRDMLIEAIGQAVTDQLTALGDAFDPDAFLRIPKIIDGSIPMRIPVGWSTGNAPHHHSGIVYTDARISRDVITSLLP